MNYQDVSFASLQFWERPVTWMYRDSRGLITTATGDLIASAGSAPSYPFLNPDGSVATASQITSEYLRVLKMPVGLVADRYRSAQSLLLPQSWVNGRLRSRIAGFEQSLRILFGSYDDQPDAAKVAEIDMIFNLGPGQSSPPSGFREYQHMIASIQAGDYAQAATQCMRDGQVAAFNDRNAWTKQMYLNAASNLPPTVPS